MSGNQVNFDKDKIPILAERIQDVIKANFSEYDHGDNRMSIYDYLTDIIATVSEFAEKVDPKSHKQIEKIVDFYQNYQEDEILRKYDLLTSAFDLMLDEKKFLNYLADLKQQHREEYDKLYKHKILGEIDLLP